jgi:hypothetical protein
MTRPTEIRIDRLVLPASERHRTDAFRAALERGLAREFGGGGPGSTGHLTAEKAARAIGDRAKRGGA